MSENNHQSAPSSEDTTSMLGEILKTADQKPGESWDFPLSDGAVATWGGPLSPKKKKSAMKPGDFLKFIGAILLVALIFFGAFLAYIVFNPGQAQFFLSFGINPGDISALLQRLVSSIFGTFTFVFSVIWIILLFRAILTKKEYKKKKTIATILSVFVGILLFSEISLWAFLVQKINATDYQNPNGGVLVYDNTKLLSKAYKDHAQLQSFDNLIGPMELKFDLRSDANLVGKLMDIEDYEIDFDGGKCRGTESSSIKGTNPQDDQSIICIFDTIKTYKPSGIYRGIDKLTHKEKSFAMVFDPINVVGIVQVRPPKSAKEHTISYDASGIAHLGNIAWYTEKNKETPTSTQKVYSVILWKEEQTLCLSIFSQTNCDKIFVVPSEVADSVNGKIVYERDAKDPLRYNFWLENVKITSGEIIGYRWMINNADVSGEDSFEYAFSGYGEQKVTVMITDSAGNIIPLEVKIDISRPMDFVKSTHAQSLLKISDSLHPSLIDDTYDENLKAYLISGIVAPDQIAFDATDVAVENFGYELADVDWDFDQDGTFEKTGKKVRFEAIEEKRYTITVRYGFVSKNKDTPEFLQEKIIVEPKKKNILASLKVTQDSDYAPTTVHADGSASQSNGIITKFAFDFGEGRGVVEGDAIQDYRYNFPGEYTLVFTVTKADGTKEVISRKIVLKDAPKRIVMNSSVYSWIVWKTVDFDTNGTVGKIESYQWDFGDGSSSQDAAPSHAYDHPGKYTIKLTAVYSDRTIKKAEKDFEVTE